jgi:hypothetical protein
MELLDRYLEAVRKQLPWERQDDIIAELRANLEAQLEDRQEEPGRTLTAEEAKAWVAQLPPPAMMAGRYRRQQYLIGPGLFPIYSLILRMVMFWVFTIAVIVNGIRLFTHPWSATAVPGAIADVAFVVLLNAAIITLIFAAIEYAGLHHPEWVPQIAQHTSKWDLSALPQIDPVTHVKKRTQARTIADAVGHTLMLCWLLLLPKYPVLILGPGTFAVHALPFTLAPVIMNFYWAVVALSVVQLAWKVMDLYTGAWMGERKLEHFAVKLMGMIPLVIALQAPEHLWIVLKDPAADFAKYGTQLAQINQAIYLGLRIVLAIVVITFLIDVVKLGLGSYKQRVIRRSGGGLI